jgi:HAD superfamily hydrolase (TIGR01509 family)
MPPRALLFDFDGVLADTENVHVAAWQRTLEVLGWEVSDEVCARAVEIDDRVFLADLFSERKIERGDVEGWVQRKQILTASMLSDSPRLYPGVAPLIQRLRRRKRVALAVVSTTWRENIETVLKGSGLLNAFAVLVGKEDVRAVKPDPECYRLALSRLGVEAGEAVALEDSASGLASARGAGLRALAIGHRLPRGEWSGPSEYVPDLTKTDEILTLLGFKTGA